MKPPSKDKDKSSKDSPSRMDSPLQGNQAQRGNQVRSIASNVFNDLPPAPSHPDDQLEDGNYEPEIDQSSVTPEGQSGKGQMHVHTDHNHQTNKSTTHTVASKSDCPLCNMG